MEEEAAKSIPVPNPYTAIGKYVRAYMFINQKFRFENTKLPPVCYGIIVLLLTKCKVIVNKLDRLRINVNQD